MHNSVKLFFMKKILLLFMVSLLINCAPKKQLNTGETEWQRKMNADFKDATKSPLTEKDRATFTGLDFFKYDSAYVVTASLKRTPEAKKFKMKTSTARLPEYVKYGVVSFKLKGKTYQLNVYQNIGLLEKEGYDDYLFLPFLDDTNGDTTYGGGRYIECRIPEGNTIDINFNEAFNPYCAYSGKYSCPIVPKEDYLPTKIEAGVKAYHKKH